MEYDIHTTEMITNLPHKTLAGGAFAMGRFQRYAGTVFWLQHSYYRDFQIMRAFHIGSKKPCALYAFRLDEEILVVAESLGSIKDEAKYYREAVE